MDTCNGCSGSTENDCLKCPESRLRLTDKNPTTCVNECPPGRLLGSNKTCFPCHSACQTCLDFTNI